MTGRGSPAPTPAGPVPAVPGSAREAQAAGLDLDGLVKVMRPRMLAFARAYVSGLTSNAAALAAGYAGSSSHKAGHRLLRDPLVRRYIHLARLEVDLSERVSLAALRAQLWAIASGQDPNASPKERENARSNLTRILLALEKAPPVEAPAAAPVPQVSADGWTADARAAFERDVLGVALDPDPRTESGSADPVRPGGLSPDPRTESGSADPP